MSDPPGARACLHRHLHLLFVIGEIDAGAEQDPGCFAGFVQFVQVFLELAVRFVLLCDESVQALFASSDGVDGTSGAAGWFLRLPRPFDRKLLEAHLENSDSATAAATLGERIMIPSAGNNLRDLYILARG